MEVQSAMVGGRDIRNTHPPRAEVEFSHHLTDGIETILDAMGLFSGHGWLDHGFKSHHAKPEVK
jgi:hypothetical protein